MKTLNSTKRSLVIVFAFLTIACGPETVLATIFIASFAGNWVEKDDPNHTIILNNKNPDSESGVLDGTETLNGTESEITGTFKGLAITNFTIKRSVNPGTSDITYTGTMVPESETVHTIKEIILKSPDDPKTLYLVMKK